MLNGCENKIKIEIVEKLSLKRGVYVTIVVMHESLGGIGEQLLVSHLNSVDSILNAPRKLRL